MKNPIMNGVPSNGKSTAIDLNVTLETTNLLHMYI